MLMFKNNGRLIQSLDELPNLKNAKHLYLDIESTSFDSKEKALRPYHGHRTCGIGVTADDASGAWYVPIRCTHEKWNLPLEAVLKWADKLINSCYEWVNHGVKFDAHFMEQDGISFNCRLVDTITLAKLINSDRLSYGLKELSREWLEEDYSSEDRLKAYLIGCKSKNYGDVPGDIIGEYGCQDVISNRKLYQYILRRRDDQVKTVWETEILLTPVLFDMEATGLHVDKLELQQKQLVTLYNLSMLEEQLHKLTGFPIRPHTNADCHEVLCNKYGLPILGRTDKQDPSFDKAAMISYRAHPLVQESELLTDIVIKIQKYRKLHTLNSIFIQPYLEHEIDGIMHPDYNQVVRTGRMSCRQPNSQQLSPEAKSLVHPPEGQEILSWDFCLPAGTFIPTPYGDKTIEEVAHSLLPVLSLTYDNKLKFCNISRGARVGHGPIYKITFDDDSTFECTSEHPFMKYDGFDFIKCKDLLPGTRLKHIRDSYGYGGDYPSWSIGCHHHAYKHRLALEWAIGDSIGALEHTHHKDRNKDNWNVDNLELMNDVEHLSMHGKENYIKQDHSLRIKNLQIALKNRRSYIGNGNPNWQGGKGMFACEVCGKPIECWPSVIRKACSDKCRSLLMSKSHIKTKVELTCEYCGKNWKVSPAQAFRVFCSRTCANRARAEYSSDPTGNYRVKSVEYVRDDWFYSITVPETGCYVTTNGLINSNSQIEFRIIIHYIKDEPVIEAYNKNPDTDFHTWVAEMCGIPRKPAKNINFAIAFGGGKARVVSMLALDMELVGGLLNKVEELVASGKINDSQRLKVFEMLCFKRGENVYQEYHDTLPGLKRTTKVAANNLVSRGFVFNAYGRHRHLPIQASYRAFNTIVQSTAADVIKERTVALAPRYNKFIRDLGINFFASVHDETAQYNPVGLSKDIITLKKIKAEFENSNFKFRVPLRIACGTSDKNWKIASGDEGKLIL